MTLINFKPFSGNPKLHKFYSTQTKPFVILRRDFDASAEVTNRDVHHLGDTLADQEAYGGGAPCSRHHP